MGASWGGLNAYTRILSALPADFPAAILLVQHQHASAENRLPWLLARYCQLPVIAPEDKEEIQPGCVYVAPPGTTCW
jgi:two-component system chemotaxis response regulator CheB